MLTQTDILRRAAGIAERDIPRDPARHSPLRLFCIDCPDARNLPPFRFPGVLPIHHRTHLRDHPGHRLQLWCWNHTRFENATGQESAGWTPSKGLYPSRTPAPPTATTGKCLCGLTTDYCDPGRIAPRSSSTPSPAACSAPRWPPPSAATPPVTTSPREPAPFTMTSDPDGPGRPGRGGRRPGAGAPRGNLNALRSGRHVADLALRAALELVPPEARPAIFAALKASGTIKAGLIVPPPANVTPIWPGARPYTSSPPPPAEQSNVGPYGELIHRLDAYRFRGAADFVRRHHRYTAALGDVLDYLDDLIESEYEKLINPAALIRADVHKTIGIPRGDVLVCPACRWSGLNITQEETGT